MKMTISDGTMQTRNVSQSLRLEIKNILDGTLERFENKEVARDIISNELAQLSVLFETARGEAVKRVQSWSQEYYELYDNPEACDERTNH